MKPRSFELVQPIVVPRRGGHEQIITAVALASVMARRADPQDPRWARWLKEAPAKSVRRVKAGAHIDQVLTWARENRIAHASLGGVLALVPLTYEEMPPRVRGAQVHGLDYDRAPLPPPATTRVRILTLGSLTTGKAAAQAAHAAWAWHLTHPAWDPGTGICLELTTPEGLARAVREPDAAAVRDGGFTEVEPGTLTAVAAGIQGTCTDSTSS